MVSLAHNKDKLDLASKSAKTSLNTSSSVNTIKSSATTTIAALKQVHASVGTLNENEQASKFITCHHYIGNSGKSSSPAHWHKEIEIMHFTSGKGFTHVCQCKCDTFDAPAVIIVPSNLIHRTCYPAHCKVNRILFSSDSIRLHEHDNALEQSINFLSGNGFKGSIVLKQDDQGFKEVVSALEMLETLSENKSQAYDPTKAQEDSIEQDKVDAFVAATFANIGSEKDRLSQLNALNQSKNKHENKPHRANAINAGSIAIASAQNYFSHDSNRNAKRIELDHHPIIIDSTNMKLFGRPLQLKGFLIIILGILYECGYLTDFASTRRQRLARSNDIKVKHLLKFIHDNYNRQMNISDLASRLDVTNQYFCRFFKQLTDMSFIDYLNDMRLQKAALEIATTQQSIREISSRHGFDTIGYFFKLFREHYKTTPMGYRSKFTSQVTNLDAHQDSDLVNLKADITLNENHETSDKIINK